MFKNLSFYLSIEERGSANVMQHFQKITKEELKEISSRGGKKSVEIKRRKKELKETLELLLSLPMRRGKIKDAELLKAFNDIKKDTNTDVQTAIISQLCQLALKGDIKAIHEITLILNGTSKDAIEDKQLELGFDFLVRQRRQLKELNEEDENGN